MGTVDGSTLHTIAVVNLPVASLFVHVKLSREGREKKNQAGRLLGSKRDVRMPGFYPNSGREVVS